MLTLPEYVNRHIEMKILKPKSFKFFVILI